MKRPAGHATVEEHPKGSGKYRVRARVGKARPVLGKNLTRSQADEFANGYASVRSEESVREGLKLETFGEAFFFRRARKGVRGVDKDRARWDKHVARAPIGKLAVSTITRRDVVDWVDSLPGAHRSRVRNLNLLRVALAEAVERELLPANPARDVKVHRSSAASSKDDLEGILTPQEQMALLGAIPDAYWRSVVAFALLTGLRQAEQYWLHWEDVGESSILVRRSVGGLPPKSGKIREVPLLEAAKTALTVLPRSKNSPLVFRTKHGARLADGKPPRGWLGWLKAAGITRKVRWHDLRHTCATALLAGWWGRKWSLDEVCKLLGHSTIAVTERYARKLNETLKIAVSETRGFAVPGVTRKELTMRNPLVDSAFVKHRSGVQPSESAPVLSPPSVGPDCGQSLWWLGPLPPPERPGEFAFLQADLGGTVRS